MSDFPIMTLGSASPNWGGFQLWNFTFMDTSGNGSVTGGLHIINTSDALIAESVQARGADMFPSIISFLKPAVAPILVLVLSALSHARGFLPAVSYPSGENPYSVAIGDFNGDGKPDLAAVNNFDNSVSILLGEGDGTFRAARTLRVCDNPQAIATGDLDGDGRLDLVLACPGVHHAGVAVLLNSAAGFLPLCHRWPGAKFHRGGGL
jgi:hypothetical protein